MLTLDILNNPNEILETERFILNMNTECITWKPMMYNPKLAISIEYWLRQRND